MWEDTAMKIARTMDVFEADPNVPALRKALAPLARDSKEAEAYMRRLREEDD
jgi:hypothetical protein